MFHVSTDYPKSRKFHSIFRYNNNQAIMFGGAYLNLDTNRHIVVNDRIWTFDFDKLEWSVLSSVKMPKPTYFHAAAINEVRSFARIFLY